MLATSLQGAPAGRDLSTLALLLLAPALFASNMVAARWAHGADLPPVFLAFGRWLLAFALLLPWVARAAWRHRRQLLAALPVLAALALLGMGVAVAPQYIGAQSTSATNIALIFSCSPLLVSLLETLIWRQPLPPGKAAGMLLALAGVLTVLSRGDVQALGSLAFGRGDLWIMLAASGWALYTVLYKRLSIPEMPDSLRLAALIGGGACMLAPAAGLEAALGGMVPWADPRLALTLLFLALVPSLGAYYAYGKLVRRAGPGTAGLSMFLVPAYAALLSWPLLGEAPRPYHAMGFALILAGVRLASFKRRAGGRMAAAA
ncbi:EamA-like transporter family protein [Bordetella hinzii CA90 BAL1384]|uniref:DMT family transporter n=1 Tax=Bordetella hinzii TaxID=103855 RepID=UPI00045AE244|nr:DMT family transporter [Bordetella hinzii]KCB27184.1 EamA-like transporter family protein [Bordetella hinzii CA90 BAL1384]WPL82154.1 DMT family transporter [Bordetella hinzii]